jgi:potassium channel subfamily K
MRSSQLFYTGESVESTWNLRDGGLACSSLLINHSIIATLMVFTVIGAYSGHYAKEFTLTAAQRTLMLQTIGFLMYLLLGALVFKRVEKWRFLDSIYYVNFTLLTIGIGSPLTPQTTLGRGLLFPFAIGGIVMIGLVIGSIRSLVIQRGKEKMQARFVEKKRQKSIRSIDPTGNGNTIKISWFKKYQFQHEGMSEPARREQEFAVMRKIEKEAAYRERWMSLALSSGATLFLWLMGAFVFSITERPQGWSYFESVYFAYTSLVSPQVCCF